MKNPIEGRTPCCGETVKVTHRFAKLRERPRNHGCKKCGKAYRCTVPQPGKVTFLE
jgi:hypothetical protein